MKQMTPERDTPTNQREFIDYRFGETNSNIAEVKSAVEQIKVQLNNSFATKDYVDGKVKDMHLRIYSLESDRKWGVRLVVGFVIMGILYAVVRFNG